MDIEDDDGASEMDFIPCFKVDIDPDVKVCFKDFDTTAPSHFFFILYPHLPFMCTLLIIPDTLGTKGNTMYVDLPSFILFLISTYCMKNRGIAQDLQELATRVDDVRRKNGLPTGSPSAWSEEMLQPITIPPPTVLPDGRDTLPIYSISFTEFSSMSGKALQTIFRRYPVIVVHGRPTRLHCDIASLEDWGDPDALRIMHGLSDFIKQHTCKLNSGIR